MNEHPQWLVAFLDAFTHLGDGPVQIGLLAIVYWSVDRMLGVRLTLLLMLSGTLNGLLKQGFAEPRPGWLNAELVTTQTPSSFGMPSGHAQSAVTWLLWPLSRGGWSTWFAAILYASMIGYSRVVIGVHSWPQVLMGWAIGLAAVYAFIWAERQSAERLEELRGTTLVLVLVSAGAGTVYLGLETVAILQGSLGSEAWLHYAERIGVAPAPGPAGIRSIVAPLGCLIGFALGEFWVGRHQGVMPEETHLRLLRALLGTILVIGVYVGVHALLPVQGEGALQLACRFAGAGLLGGTVSALAPWSFSLLGLGEGADRGTDDAPESE